MGQRVWACCICAMAHPTCPASPAGGHERGRRPGTVNVAGAVGTAAAMKYIARERASQAARLSQLRDKLIAGVLSVYRMQR